MSLDRFNLGKTLLLTLAGVLVLAGTAPTAGIQANIVRLASDQPTRLFERERTESSALNFVLRTLTATLPKRTRKVEERYLA